MKKIFLNFEHISGVQYDGENYYRIALNNGDIITVSKTDDVRIWNIYQDKQKKSTLEYLLTYNC